MALRKMIPTFNIGGTKPAAAAATTKTETARPILRSIGNQDAAGAHKALKAKVEPRSMLPTLSGILRTKEAAKPELPVEARPMETDAPVLCWPAPPPGVENIDDEEADNPMLVAEYVNEIYAYMRDLETRHAVAGDYLATTQKDTQINEKMRGILVDWLVEVHQRFKLLQETFFMTIDLMDRFLAVHPTQRNKLQLVGITAMLIASKYEEMYPPEVRDFVYIADNAYTRQEILAMEALILRKLDFNLGTPLPLHFLRRFSRACHADSQVHTLAKYFMELKSLSYGMVRFTPSETAAAAILIARKVCDETAVWTPTLVHYSGYSETALEPVVATMHTELARSVAPGALGAIRRKYANAKLQRTSELPALEAYISALPASA